VISSHDHTGERIEAQPKSKWTLPTKMKSNSRIYRPTGSRPVDRPNWMNPIRPST